MRYYAKLETTALTDGKILAAGPLAFAVWAKGLLYSKEHLTDGFVPDGAIPLLGIGVPDLPSVVDALVVHGLWERVDGGYTVGSERWARHQTTKDDVEKSREAARERQARSRAGRRRHADVTPEDQPKTEASHASVTRDTGESHADVTEVSQPGHAEVTEPENRDTEKEISPKPPAGAVTRKRGSPPASDLDREFDEFKAVFPRRLGDAKAAKGRERFGKLRAAGVDLDRLLEGAKRYAAFCDATAKTRTEFVQQIPTWLNGRGWELDWEIPDDAPNRPKQVSTGPEPVYRVAEGQAEEPPPPAEREGRQGLRHASGNGLTESDKRKLIQAQIEQARAGHA